MVSTGIIINFFEDVIQMQYNKEIYEYAIKKAKEDKKWVESVNKDWLNRASEISIKMYERKKRATVEEIAKDWIKYFLVRIFYCKSSYMFFSPDWVKLFEDITGIKLNCKLTPIRQFTWFYPCNVIGKGVI
jgi:hypothetical protein